MFKYSLAQSAPSDDPTWPLPGKGGHSGWAESQTDFAKMVHRCDFFVHCVHYWKIIVFVYFYFSLEFYVIENEMKKKIVAYVAPASPTDLSRVISYLVL